MASASAKKETPGPFYIPRQIAEWRKHVDSIWCEKTNLARFWNQMKDKVDLKLCHEFINSMKTRDENEELPSGMVQGILVQYSPRYLCSFFGWDGTGVLSWNESCRG